MGSFFGTILDRFLIDFRLNCEWVQEAPRSRQHRRKMEFRTRRASEMNVTRLGEHSERASVASDVSRAMGMHRHCANCCIMVSVCIFFTLARFPFIAKTGLSWEGFSLQDASKTRPRRARDAPKTRPRWPSIFDTIFHRFWIDLGAQKSSKM